MGSVLEILTREVGEVDDSSTGNDCDRFDVSPSMASSCVLYFYLLNPF